MNRIINAILKYLNANRDRLIKALVVAAGILLLVLLIYYGVDYVQTARYEKRVAAADKAIAEADARAKGIEREAEILKDALEGKYAQLNALRTRAEIAEGALKNARRIVTPLKEEYEEARTNPVVPADTTCAAACAELAGLGHACK